MKYFIINTIIRDGEYDYLSQSAYKAKNSEEALEMAKTDAEDWTAYDYREYEIKLHSEITAKEYKVISKYIY